MHPHSFFALLFGFTLPVSLLGMFVPMLLPLISSTVATVLHTWLVKGETWYSTNCPHAVQMAIAVVVGLAITAGAAFFSGIPGADAVIAACGASASAGVLSSDCLTSLQGLASASNITLALTAILTAAGVLHGKQVAIHEAQKAMAYKAGVSLPPSAR